MNLNVANIMKELQKERPIFHSEADFQHALAWKIHLHDPAAAVRLEVNKGAENQREYLDILVRDIETTLAIELKYKTKMLDVEINREEFHLLSQGAYLIGRYDFVKDIARLERFVAAHRGTVGCALFLTNDKAYWEKPRNFATADAMFRLHEKCTLNGELRWSEATGAGTMKDRESPLCLRGSHSIRWSDYSKLDVKGPDRFRYVLLEVGSE